jgi:hypothetical protein
MLLRTATVIRTLIASRWRTIESGLLAAGAERYERNERSRRAERRRMAWRAGDAKDGVQTRAGSIKQDPACDCVQTPPGLKNKTRPTYHSPQMINFMNVSLFF